jgi:F-type H+-transporting ATPase subunit delta
VRETTVARNYAETLFRLGDKHGQLDGFAAALEVLVTALDSDPRVRQFIETPKIDVDRKKDALARALGGSVSPLFMNFVRVVLDKRRERLFTEIARLYQELLDEHTGRLHAQVTLAHMPDAAGERRLADELSRALGRTVIPHIRVDEQILGGIVVRYGDHVLDGSVRRRLLSLRNRLRHSTVPAGVR